MASATIKLFLPLGDGKRLRTAEISNWSGKALAAPRTDLDKLLLREELAESGVYILTGDDEATGRPKAYIGEAEILRERLRMHRSREFWINVIVFVSKDENLTKSHIKYLEGRLITDATAANRFVLDNSQSSGSRLPESDRHDMEQFLEKIVQLLPVLGSELLSPVASLAETDGAADSVTTTIKGLTARGHRTPNGFVVLEGSQAVPELRDACRASTKRIRDELLADGGLARQSSPDRLVFTRSVEFTTPSAAACVIHGGSVSGPGVWYNQQGVSLAELERD